MGWNAETRRQPGTRQVLYIICAAFCFLIYPGNAVYWFDPPPSAGPVEGAAPRAAAVPEGPGHSREVGPRLCLHEDPGRVRFPRTARFHPREGTRGIQLGL